MIARLSARLTYAALAVVLLFLLLLSVCNVLLKPCLRLKGHVGTRVLALLTPKLMHMPHESVTTKAGFSDCETSNESCCVLQFSKGFEKKDVPSGKGYIRLTPQPNVA